MKRGCVIVVALFGLLYLVGLVAGPPKPSEPRSVQIQRGCEREFPYDRQKQTECFTEITVRELREIEREKIERAAE